MNPLRFLAPALVALALPAAAFDHTHAAWDALLKRHVRYVENGHASRVDYAGMQRDMARLDAVLADDQTVKKILTRYPDIRSIRDFGTVFGNPWKDKFFTLFGAPATLDMVEHEMLRKPGVYDEPRIHFAVVCASIGCPMLRDEAFTADKLDAQLGDGIRRFLSDRSRNRYDPAKGRLEVSRIFDWYGSDFEKGHRGYTSLKATFAKYADLLADRPEDRAAVQAQRADIAFLDYDWSLNDAKP